MHAYDPIFALRPASFRLQQAAHKHQDYEQGRFVKLESLWALGLEVHRESFALVTNSHQRGHLGFLENATPAKDFRLIMREVWQVFRCHDWFVMCSDHWFQMRVLGLEVRIIRSNPCYE